MTPSELLYSLSLAAVGGGLAIAAGRNRRESIGVALFFEASFWFRTLIVFLNGRYHLLPEKPASDISMTLINQQGGVLQLFRANNVFSFLNMGNMKFMVEALLNLPGTRLFEDSQIILNLTNALMGALSGVIVFAYMRRLFDRRIAVGGLLVTSLYPAAVNFSFFALRDVIIYALLLVNLLSFAWLVLRQDHCRANAAIYVASLLLLVPTRVAFVPFLLILPGGFLLHRIRRELRDLQAQRKPVMLAAAVLALSLNGSGMILGSYYLILHHVGYASLVTPTELLKDYALSRASRGTQFQYRDGRLMPASMNQNPKAQRIFLASQGQGAASEYLPIEKLSTMSLPARAAVQIGGFMLLPYPWQLNSPVRILALFDSFFVWFCLYGAWQVNALIKRYAEGSEASLPLGWPAYPAETLRLFSQLLLVSFVAAWFCLGIIVSDAGNAFRMRINLQPFIVFGASLFAVMLLDRLRQRQSATASALTGQIA